jgi:prolyl-tRNA editing enzyme YbaK/EbsC (Cys-tRNA(Pro) deacylase)
MASAEEVRAVTGCIPGAVPPFGSLWRGKGVWRTVVDRSLLEQGDEVNFNAGLRTRSVVGLKVAAYLAVEDPLVAVFSAAT